MQEADEGGPMNHVFNIERIFGKTSCTAGTRFVDSILFIRVRDTSSQLTETGLRTSTSLIWQSEITSLCLSETKNWCRQGLMPVCRVLHGQHPREGPCWADFDQNSLVVNTLFISLFELMPISVDE